MSTLPSYTFTLCLPNINEHVNCPAISDVSKCDCKCHQKTEATVKDQASSPLAKTSLHQSALWYAQQGIPVFALISNTKKPIQNGGFHNASKDVAIVEQMWADNPNANIGIPTGHVSGIIAIDFDCKKNMPGMEQLAKWEQEHGPLITRTQYTPSGGIQKLFQMPQFDIRCSASIIAMGVDVRGNGGYIAAAPSAIDGKQYAYENAQAPLEPLPDWLLQLLLTTKSNTHSVDWDEDQAIPSGRRNDTLYRMGCSQRRYGMNAENIFKLLRHVNETQCDPPLDDEEIILIAEEAAKYSPSYTGEPGNTDGERWLAESMATDPSWGLNSSTLELQPAGTIPKPKVRPKVYRHADVRQIVGQEIPYLVKPYIPQGVVVDLFAKIKAGKTILSLNLAAAICEGGLFLGEQAVQSPVLYLTEQNFYSFDAELGMIWPTGAPDNLGIIFVHEKAQLTWSEMVDLAVEEAEKRQAKLVVIDTFSRWAGFDENQENDAASGDKAIGELSKLTAKGITVLIDRHGRKSGGDISDAARGSSAIGGGADVLLHLKHKEGNPNGSRKRIIEAVGRYPLPTGPIEIELGSHNRYSCNGVAVSEQSKEDRDTVLDVLSSTEWMSRSQLMDLTGLSKLRVHKAISKLEHDSVVERQGEGSKADPYLYRRII